MTTKKTLFPCIFLFSFLFACQHSDVIELPSDNWMAIRLAPMNMPRPADAYDYPCLPGTPEWAKLTSADERTEACLIPDAIVSAQSTQGVIQDIWEYPSFPDFIVYSSSTGLQKVFASDFIPQSNMYKELLTRKDMTDCLLERYRRMEPSFDRWNATLAFEALLGMDEIIARLSLSEQKEMIGLALEKDRIRVKRNINKTNRSLTWYLIGKILQSAGYEPFLAECAQNQPLSLFLQTSMLSEEEITLDRIAAHGKKFIKK